MILATPESQISDVDILKIGPLNCQKTGAPNCPSGFLILTFLITLAIIFVGKFVYHNYLQSLVTKNQPNTNR